MGIFGVVRVYRGQLITFLACLIVSNLQGPKTDRVQRKKVCFFLKTVKMAKSTISKPVVFFSYQRRKMGNYWLGKKTNFQKLVITHSDLYLTHVANAEIQTDLTPLKQEFQELIRVLPIFSIQSMKEQWLGLITQGL